nr:ORF1 [Enterovirus F]UDL09392.1 ORF1 [Enterovirus F]
MLLILTSERVRTIQCCYVVMRKSEAEQTTFGTPCFLYFIFMFYGDNY